MAASQNMTLMGPRKKFNGKFGKIYGEAKKKEKDQQNLV